LVDRERGTLIGVTFTGPEVAESLHAATVAVVGQVPVATLMHAIPSFPTRSEVWLALFEGYRKEG
jgi:dihydrolipoamide dehydrogenase